MTGAQISGPPGTNLAEATPGPTPGPAGYALQNASGVVILSWQAPNDGNLHWVTVLGELVVSSAETGGLINLVYTDPNGTQRTNSAWSGGLAASAVPVLVAGGMRVLVAPGTVVQLVQANALTVGAAILNAAFQAE